MRSFTRRAAAPLLVLAAALALPSAAIALPGLEAHTPSHVTAPASLPKQIMLTATDGSDAPISFEITTAPTHGTATLAAEPECVMEPGLTTCTVAATYTSSHSYLGADSFEFVASTFEGGTSAPAVVSITSSGTAPVLPATSTGTVGTEWSAVASSVLPGAHVNFGDGVVNQPLASTSPSVPLRLSHTFAQVGSYVVSVTNSDASGVVTSTMRVEITPVSVVQSVTGNGLVSVPPGQIGSMQAPGLYVSVVSGLISITARGNGSLNFSAGQFGFTPSMLQPPVLIPRNPGLQLLPPPMFAQVKPQSVATVQISGGASAGASATIDMSYTPKLFCNGGKGAVDCIVRSTRTKFRPFRPELWYVAPNGTLQPVIGSTKSGVASGVNTATGVVTATFDSTSTPSLESMAKTTRLATIIRPLASAKTVTAARVVGWPRASTQIVTGGSFTCPAASRTACTVRTVARSSQFGVNRLVGSRVLKVSAGRTTPLNFTLTPHGRWRVANGGLQATVAVSATASAPSAPRGARTFRITATLPRG
ncbi:MAG: iron dicitrate transport regulator FecR [Thermoleophilia bacterium]|nr:iron dicitrate transport regulator FecR [Thermoleophilia bacterium]